MSKLPALLFVLLASTAEGTPAWPTDATGAKMPCWDVKVLEDTNAGWHGGCLGLAEQNGGDATTAAACEKACTANVECSVWQLTGEDKCWLGLPGHPGTQCYGRNGEEEEEGPFVGQRVQQGQVSVVSNTTTFWYEGLKHQPMMSAGDAETDKNRCRMQCYSDINCTYWQYGTDECWLEDYQHKKTTKTDSTDVARTMVYGEEISQTCSPPPKPEEPFFTWPVIIGLILLGLLLLAVIAFLCKPKPKVKKTRAVKVTPKKEDPPPTYTMMQPTYTTYVQPSPQYQMVPQEIVQPPVTYAAPVQQMVVEQAPLLAPAPVMGSVQIPMAQPVMVAEQAPLLAPMMPGGSVVLR